MAVRNESDLEAQSQSVAEYLFLIMLVLMVAVPVSGMALSVSSWFSSIYAKGEYQFVSTKNLAEQLLNKMSLNWLASSKSLATLVA